MTDLTNRLVGYSVHQITSEGDLIEFTQWARISEVYSVCIDGTPVYAARDKFQGTVVALPAQYIHTIMPKSY